MKYLLSFFVVLCFACNTNKGSQSLDLEGTWLQETGDRIAGDPAIDKKYKEQFEDEEHHLTYNKNDSYLIIEDNGKKPSAHFEFSLEGEDDMPCEKFVVKGKEITFEKKISDLGRNYFKLKVKDKKTLVGEMKSWNGNTYKVVFKKMPEGYEIKKNEFRT